MLRRARGTSHAHPRTARHLPVNWLTLLRLGSKNLVWHGHIGPGAVRLHVHRLDLAVLDEQGIPLGPLAAKKRRRVEAQVQGSGESSRGISKEAKLPRRQIYSYFTR